MKKGLFLSQTSNLFAQNRLLKFFVILIGLCELFNVYTLQKVKDDQMVVLLPRGLDEKAQVSKRHMDDAYIKAFAKDVIQTAFTFHPLNVRSQFEDVLTLYAPEAYQDAYSNFYGLAEIISKANISSVVHILTITIDPRKSEVEVTAVNTKNKEDKRLEQKQRKYVIKYTVQNARMYVLGITEQEGI